MKPGRATGSLVAAIAAAIALVVVFPALAFAGMLFIAQSSAITSAAAAAQCSPYRNISSGSGGATQQIANTTFTTEQLANAQTIVTVAVQRGLPTRAAVLALATAMVESELRNVNYGDRDSLGLFQQRPSQGWGSPSQILDPVYSANKFYDTLVRLPGWHTMPPGIAEQTVQRSGFPLRYAPREPAAAALAEKFWQGPDNPVAPVSTSSPVRPVDFAAGGCPDTGQGNLDLGPGDFDRKKLPEGFSLPTDPQRSAAVTYALAQLGKPYVWGAEGPDGFDCSGLMQAAWAHAAVAISRTTTSQRHDGVAVGSLSQALPGDLLFIPGSLGTAANPRHVGMYVGNNHVVDAYDTSRGVILTTLASWAPKVVAIRRIVQGPVEQPPGDGDPRS